MKNLFKFGLSVWLFLTFAPLCFSQQAPFQEFLKQQEGYLETFKKENPKLYEFEKERQEKN